MKSLDRPTEPTLMTRRLVRNGIVARRVVSLSPVAVEYAVTPLGRTLKRPFETLYAWTFEHLPAVERARDAFDRGMDL